MKGVQATIVNTDIAITLPCDTTSAELSAMPASFNITGARVEVGGVEQLNGVTTNDFCTPVIYTVFSKKGSSKSYTVNATIAVNDAKAITMFSINGVQATLVGTNIDLVLPFGTDRTDLVATFNITGRVVTVDNVDQVSGVTHNNFTTPKEYTVEDCHGATQIYTVTVTTAPSDAKAITAFSINGVNAAGLPASINGSTLSLTLPCKDGLTGLTATFTADTLDVTVDGVPQISGVTSNDFTAPKTYTVKAADGSTASYIVTVDLSTDSNMNFTSFSINGVNGTIDEDNHTITLELPYSTVSLYLPAEFIINGKKATVGDPDNIQQSGVTYNNFESPVTYTVHACDGINTQDYTVTVTKALPKTTKDLLSFSIGSVNGTITANGDINNINLTLPKGSSLNRRAIFTTNGHHVTVNNVTQVSGSTYNDFTGLVTYTVHAEDGSVKDYLVDVSSFTVMVTTFDASDTIINRKAYIYKNAAAYLSNLVQAESGTQAPYVDTDMYIFSQNSYKYSEGTSNAAWFDGDDVNPRYIVKYPVDSFRARFVTYNDFNRSSIAGYYLHETDSNGRIIKTTCFTGTGIDGAWFTDDDERKSSGVAINQTVWADASNAHTDCYAADGTTLQHQWDLIIDSDVHTIKYVKYDSFNAFVVCFVIDYASALTHWTRFYSDADETVLTQYIKQTMSLKYNEPILSEKYIEPGDESIWYNSGDIEGYIDGYPYTMTEHDDEYGYQTAHQAFSMGGSTLQERAEYTTE